MTLLVRLPNWVGDVCMALPAIAALDERGAALHLVGRRWAVDLLAGHGWPVHVAPDRILPTARGLAAIGARRGVLFTNSLSSAAAFRLAGVSAIGHRGDGRTLLLGRGIAKPPALHEVQVFWRLAGAAIDWLRLGEPPLVSPPVRLGLCIGEAHRTSADAALRLGLDTALDDPRGFVVLAPLAAGRFDGASKAWPGFGALSRRLARRGIVTVCCPGPGEDEAARAALPETRLLPGLGLGAFAAVCARARLVVSNDSGPMHLAAAVDAPVIGVFGPSRPARTHPWGARSRWLGGDGRWPAAADVDAAVDAALGG